MVHFNVTGKYKMNIFRGFMETRICCTNLSLMPHCLCILFNGLFFKKTILIYYLYICPSVRPIMEQSNKTESFFEFSSKLFIKSIYHCYGFLCLDRNRTQILYDTIFFILNLKSKFVQNLSR